MTTPYSASTEQMRQGATRSMSPQEALHHQQQASLQQRLNFIRSDMAELSASTPNKESGVQ